ncbi:MAG: TetR/AcrR family transcriptional regulator [Bacteroidota bacterium]
MPTPVQQRRLEEKEARRQQILDAAEAVLGRKGFDAVVLADVAKQARLSRALLYTYFHDKVDLYHAVGVRASNELRWRFEKAAAAHTRGMDRVDAIGLAYIRFAEERPVLFEALARVEAREIDPEAEERPNALAALRASHGTLATLAEAVAQGVADGSIRADIGDPAQTAIALWGVVHGIVQVTAHKEAVLGALGTDRQSVHDHVFSLIDRAMAPES